ncbi:MAG: hypothetical protein HYY37_00330 [Candidatus Aenigmarchaeota archaeon]|nr:hypothetical protein [Candidatus Aenigmarchaeota archaeon]
MERVGILVVSYGARACSIIDALSRSDYHTEFYIADKQRNPFNAKRAKEHAIIPNLDVQDIAAFAKKHKGSIDFGIVGPENPIIDGIRDVLEPMGIPMLCPTKEFAVEGSKVLQRQLLHEAAPDVNPRFRVFDRKDYASIDDARKDVFSWLDELGNQAAVKPDKPGFGKGVGVWGDHFATREDLWQHFLTIFGHSPVIIEEKIEGEEFSLQFVSDGTRLVPTPAVRDYKRAFDGDKGPNTGGMGSYKDAGNILPFMSRQDWDDALAIGQKVFAKLKGTGSNTGLRGVWYFAFVCAPQGLKVFEINTRFGMPEAQCLMPTLQDDFVETCFSIISGNLHGIRTRNKASVAIYKVPPTYGGKAPAFEGTREVDLNDAEKLASHYHDQLRIYPCSMELRDGKTYALNSRTVCAVGIGDSIHEARRISMEGVHAIHGNLWNRMDAASDEHIQGSIGNMKRLRSAEN